MSKQADAAAQIPSVLRTSHNNTPVLNNAAHNIIKTNSSLPSQSLDTLTFATNFKNQFGESISAMNDSTSASSTSGRSSDFFDAFHDQFNKNTNSSKPNVDPFGVTSNNNPAINSQTASFGDNLFEDEFAKVKITNDFEAPNSKNLNTSDFAKFDNFNNDHAFSQTVAASANFADFEDSFSSAFTTKPEVNLKHTETGAIPKDKNSNSGDASTTARYAADYSKGESFDKDLDEVIKRSLVDQ